MPTLTAFLSCLVKQYKLCIGHLILILQIVNEIMTAHFRYAEDFWKRAFQKLEVEDAEILRKNEKQLAELNDILIDKALYENKSRQWCITLGGKPLKIRELGAKIISSVSSSQDYLSKATSVEPHAALAWTCISLLLPVSPWRDLVTLLVVCNYDHA